MAPLNQSSVIEETNVLKEVFLAIGEYSAAGVELMHNLILDMLGRTTRAAIVFR